MPQCSQLTESCGAALLLRLLELSEKSGKVPRPSYINCRANDYMSPAAFANNLLECMQNSWRFDASEFARLVSGLSVDVLADGSVRLGFASPPESSAMKTVLDAYTRLVTQARAKRAPGDPLPVLIVDQANKLMTWDDEKTLKALLAFFVMLTKETQLAHVVLATNDAFLAQWLHDRASAARACAVSNAAHTRTCLSHASRHPQRVSRRACAACVSSATSRRRRHTASYARTCFRGCPTRPSSQTQTGRAYTRRERAAHAFQPLLVCCVPCAW